MTTTTTTATRTIISTAKNEQTQTDLKPKKPYKLYLIIDRFRAAGFSIVADFLTTKARKSMQTALTYSSGMTYISRFIQQEYNGKYNVETILKPLRSKKIDVYKFLNSFVDFLQNGSQNGYGGDLSPRTITLYVTTARSYFAYNDIEISLVKFKNRISLPPIYQEDEQPIDANDIKEILHHCDNKRLKAYLLVLASGGMRAIEALAIRESDIDFTGINFADPHDGAVPFVFAT
jgi:integrase